MKIKALKLKQFRCYNNKYIEFSPSKTIIVGPNAIGKTTIIEAIYLLSIGKSPRSSNECDLIKIGEHNFFVEGNFFNDLKQLNVTISFDGKFKKIKKDESPIRRLSEYLGTINTVWFSSNDLNLINGSPAERRLNFDRIFCQISQVYYGALSNYKKFLKERNALLKRLILENNSNNLILLDVITNKLVSEGKIIISIRNKIIKKINLIMADKHYQIGSDKEDVGIIYCPSIVFEDYEKTIKEIKDEDIKHGNTSLGPHRDDYIFIINNKNIGTHGSQGQQRDAVLALKLAEVDLLFEVKKDYPILLLDDVFSELDKKRQNNLLNGLNKEVQTLITTTSINEIDSEILKDSVIIEMKEGR